MNCNDIRPYLEAFVDSELSPERTLDVEGHLEQCEACRSEVDLSRTLSAVTRSAISEVEICPDFQARLCRCMASERKRQERKAVRPLPMRFITPLAAAAGLTLAFGAAQRGNLPGFEALLGSTETQLVDLLLKHHSAPPEPEVMAQDSLEAMEPALGFPVHAPNLERYGARFVGANLVNVDRAHAASLHYSMTNGRRVTFYVYDPEELPLRAMRSLRPRVVRNQAVFVGQRKGYSIATCERHGVGYAVAADLSDTESAELVAAVNH
jgi:anti-sigma factor RsiW